MPQWVIYPKCKVEQFQQVLHVKIIFSACVYSKFMISIIPWFLTEKVENFRAKVKFICVSLINVVLEDQWHRFACQLSQFKE